MSKHYRTLIICLALTLIVSNMAFSAHLASHQWTDSGLCSLCVQSGGASTAIAPGLTAPIAKLNPIIPTQDNQAVSLRLLVLHDHQSRAPPRLS